MKYHITWRRDVVFMMPTYYVTQWRRIYDRSEIPYYVTPWRRIYDANILRDAVTLYLWSKYERGDVVIMVHIYDPVKDERLKDLKIKD